MDVADEARMRKNFLTALNLHETGVMIMRQNLRRRYPDESDEQIGTRLRAWLHRDHLRSIDDPSGFLKRPKRPGA